MNRIRIHFYGKLADMIGRSVDLDWAEESGSVGDLRARLAQRFPNSREALSRPYSRACLGDVMVDDHDRIEAGATVEFFPPVSGG